jgi:hypothetical protein
MSGGVAVRRWGEPLGEATLLLQLKEAPDDLERLRVALAVS